MTDYMELLLKSRDGLFKARVCSPAGAMAEPGSKNTPPPSGDESAMSVKKLLLSLTETVRQAARGESGSAPAARAQRAGEDSAAVLDGGAGIFAASDTGRSAADMRELSDFFERDARRYPGAFKTY